MAAHQPSLPKWVHSWSSCSSTPRSHYPCTPCTHSLQDNSELLSSHSPPPINRKFWLLSAPCESDCERLVFCRCRQWWWRLRLAVVVLAWQSSGEAPAAPPSLLCKKTISLSAIFNSTQGGTKPLNPDSVLVYEVWIFHRTLHGSRVIGCLYLPA